MTGNVVISEVDALTYVVISRAEKRVPYGGINCYHKISNAINKVFHKPRSLNPSSNLPIFLLFSLLSFSPILFLPPFFISLLFSYHLWQFLSVCTLCFSAGCQSDGLDCQRAPHGANLHVRQYCGTHVMQHPVAREWTYQRSGRVYPLLFHPGVRYSPTAHLRVLLPSHTQTENRGAKEQIQREEKVPPEGHQIGTYGHSCVCPVLAAILDHSGL